MAELKQLILKILNCYLLGNHEWTCKAKEGIEPTTFEIIDAYGGFKEYAKMYCKRCGKYSKLNERL